MMNEEAFSQLVNEIMSQGHDEATAARYAAIIGDMPVTDEHGNVWVMQGKDVLAKLKPLKFFEAE